LLWPNLQHTEFPEDSLQEVEVVASEDSLPESVVDQDSVVVVAVELEVEFSDT
jgi:hypothetical protein